MTHMLFLTLLHGRGLFRLGLSFLTLCACGYITFLGLLLPHAHDVPGTIPAHQGLSPVLIGIPFVILGSYALRWQYDAMLRRMSPSGTFLITRT